MLMRTVLCCHRLEGSRFQRCFSTPYPLRRSDLRPSSWATRSSIGKVCPPAPCPALPLHCMRLLSLFLRARLTTPCLALCRSSFGRFLRPQDHPSTPWRRFFRSFAWSLHFLSQMSSSEARAFALVLACVVAVRGGVCFLTCMDIFPKLHHCLVCCSCYLWVGWG